MKKIYLAGLLFSSLSTFGITLDENDLIEMAQKQNPTLSDIEANYLSSQVRSEELNDKFGFELYSGYNHENTKEKASISFQPVFSTVNQYKVGVKKYTKYGAVLDLSRSVDVRSAQKNYTDLTTTTNSLNIQIDLWKDFMGSMTRAQVDNLEDLKKKDELQKSISVSTLKNNARKLYWSLIANTEKLKITNRLYETSKKQAANAKKRKANSISDKAEVASFNSLVHQRKGQILLLKYEREILLKQLRDLFPQLNSKDISFAKYNLDKTIFEVLECTAKINAQESIPYSHTKFDEVVQILRKVEQRQNKIDSKYDDIDLALNLTLKEVGVGSETTDNSNYKGSYSDSIDDLNDNDRSGMSAGILLTIPFGEDKASTAAVKEELTKKQFHSQLSSLESNVKATHEQVRMSVKILSEVIKEQKLNSKELQVRVSEMQRKYNQARIPEYALIQDQDSLLQSDLNVVDTQLTVVTTILDYFSVFNNFPCSFNRK